MNDNHSIGSGLTRDASILDSAARASAFTTLRPALENLLSEADTDPRLSRDARRVLRAVTRTRPEHTLSLPDLAARASTPKTRIPAALNELEDHGYLTRTARIAPHLIPALPTHTAPEPAGDTEAAPHNQSALSPTT